MKILLVIAAYEPAWHLGGIVRCESLLARAMAAAGADVTVYTTDSGITGRLDVPVNQPLDIGGVRAYYFRTDWSLSYFYSRALARACHETIRDYDILNVVSFWCYPGLVACREARTCQVPYVMTPHGVLMPESLQHNVARKKLYMAAVEGRNLRGAVAIRYTTELERQSCRYLNLSTPSYVVPNGLDMREFEALPTRSEARARLGWSPEAKTILYLGRLHPRKALDVLVLAFAHVVEQISTAYLVLAGPDDGHEAALRRLVNQLGLGHKVLFAGFVDKQKRLDVLAAADLSTLVSYPGDNFGMSIAESMAAGIPVLVSHSVGLYRDISDDAIGEVVKVDKDSIIRALLRMLSNPDGLRAMGQRAAACARKRYDIRNVAQQMLQAFEDILTGQRSSGLGWSDHQPPIEAR